MCVNCSGMKTAVTGVSQTYIRVFPSDRPTYRAGRSNSVQWGLLGRSDPRVRGTWKFLIWFTLNSGRRGEGKMSASRSSHDVVSLSLCLAERACTLFNSPQTTALSAAARTPKCFLLSLSCLVSSLPPAARTAMSGVRRPPPRHHAPCCCARPPIPLRASFEKADGSHDLTGLLIYTPPYGPKNVSKANGWYCSRNLIGYTFVAHRSSFQNIVKTDA